MGQMSPIWRSSLRSKGFKPHIRHPALGPCIGKMSLPNIWFWKSAGLNSRRTETLFSKGPCTNTLTLRSSTEGGLWKAPGPHVKEIYQPILWHLPKEQKVVRTFSADGSAHRPHFPYSPSTYLAWHRWVTFLIPPIYLTTTTHPTQVSPCGSVLPNSPTPKWLPPYHIP